MNQNVNKIFIAIALFFSSYNSVFCAAKETAKQVRQYAYHAWQRSSYAPFWRRITILSAGMWIISSKHPERTCLLSACFGLLSVGSYFCNVWKLNQLLLFYPIKPTTSVLNPVPLRHNILEAVRILRESLLYTLRGSTVSPHSFVNNNLSQWCNHFVSRAPHDPRDDRFCPPQRVFERHLTDVTQAQINVLHAQLTEDDRTKTNSAKPLNNNLIYTKRITLEKDSRIIALGDLHGDMQALAQQFLHWKEQGIVDDAYRILPEKQHFIFCGDFVDRGMHGIEVVSTLLKFKLANPDQVHLVRGNHEDINSISGGRVGADYFKGQIMRSYGLSKDDTFFTLLGNFYGSLPVALFIRVQENITTGPHAIFTHGCGIELAYPLDEILKRHEPQVCHILTSENAKSRLTQYPADGQDPAIATTLNLRAPHLLVADLPGMFTPGHINYVWGKITDQNNCYQKTGDWFWGQRIMQQHLRENKIALSFRAHQHNASSETTDPISKSLNDNGISIIPGSNESVPIITHVTTPQLTYTPFSSHVQIALTSLNPTTWRFTHTKYQNNTWIQTPLQVYPLYTENSYATSQQTTKYVKCILQSE